MGHQSYIVESRPRLSEDDVLRVQNANKSTTKGSTTALTSQEEVAKANTESFTVSSVNITTLMLDHGITPGFDVVKLTIEGSERQVFSHEVCEQLP